MRRQVTVGRGRPSKEQERVWLIWWTTTGTLVSVLVGGTAGEEWQGHAEGAAAAVNMKRTHTHTPAHQHTSTHSTPTHQHTHTSTHTHTHTHAHAHTHQHTSTPAHCTAACHQPCWPTQWARYGKSSRHYQTWPLLETHSLGVHCVCAHTPHSHAHMSDPSVHAPTACCCKPSSEW